MTAIVKVAVLAAFAAAASTGTILVAAAPVAAQQTQDQARAQEQARLQAQEDAAVAALRSSLTAEAHASFVAAIRDARQRGLPVQPLIGKAQEGAAKNVDASRILAAVEQTRERLVRAQTLLRAASSGAAGAAAGPARADAGMEISAVADALQRGVPDDAIARLVSDARGQGSVGLSAHALADLIGHGVPLAIGLEVIGAWRGHGADPARLNEIPAAIERLVRQGVVPARAGAAVAAGLRTGRAPGSIRPGDVGRMIGG
jgi:hypothetical protein